MPFACKLHHHMELLRFKTFFKDGIIGLLSGPHAHPMVLHKLSAINSFKKKEDPCVPISFWLFCNFSFHRPPMSHPSFFQIGRAAS